MKVFILFEDDGNPDTGFNIIAVFSTRELAESFNEKREWCSYGIWEKDYISPESIRENFEKERAEEYQADILSDYESTHGVIRE